MFDSLCAFPLESELFAQAVHPTAPVVAVGLTSGHVAALRIPPIAGEAEGGGEAETTAAAGQKNGHRRGSDGTGFIDTAWRTRRHKGSCRCLTYSLDGLTLYSAGTDGIVKAASSETGKVTSKLAIPHRRSPSSSSSSLPPAVDSPTVIHALSPQTLLLSTDSGALHLYDLRIPPSPSPSQTYHPHPDFISSLTPLPPTSTSTSGFSKQFLTTGGTTLALTDLRRGVLAKSADQEELLLSSAYISGLPVRKGGTSTGEKALVGGGDGVLTLWEKGQWDDQDERIIVSREKETVDCLSLVPGEKMVAVGLGDGNVRFVKLGVNKVVGEVRHDEVEGVVGLGFDGEGRMISGGGMIVKVWGERIEEDDEDREEEEERVGKRAGGSDGEGEEDGEGDSSEEEEAAERQRRRKKRRKGKGPVGNVKKFDFAGLD